MTDAAAARRAEPLSQELVVDAARRLTKAHGVEGLTMRSVAAELGVTPMALYYHVANKDELVALVAAAVLEGTPSLGPGAQDWEAALRDYLMSTWRVMREYPGLAGYMINLPTMGTTADVWTNGARFFEEIGFDRKVAPYAVSFALTFIHGRLSVDAHLDPGAAHEAGLDTLPAAQHVEFGVDAVIAGLRALVEHPELTEKYTRRRR